jgi:hypothetical protein
MQKVSAPAGTIPFWPTKPPRSEPLEAWPDGAGWIIAAAEETADGGRHVTLSRIGADERRAAVACDLDRPGRGIRALASAPDAIYAVVGGLDDRWAIVEVSRAALEGR